MNCTHSGRRGADPREARFDFNHAVQRVAAAAEAARAHPFTLTARTKNCLRGHPDLDDTSRCLQALEKAGADVLFAPGPPDLAAARTVCAPLSKPFSFMAGVKGKSFSVVELQTAAREVKENGSFGDLDRL